MGVELQLAHKTVSQATTVSEEKGSVQIHIGNLRVTLNNMSMIRPATGVYCVEKQVFLDEFLGLWLCGFVYKSCMGRAAIDYMQTVAILPLECH